jgi:hypothetical protein
VSVRKDFKSTTGTTRPQALRPRLTTWIARNNLFPLVQLLALNRYLIERRMSRIQWAAQPSQIAFSSDSKG